MKTVKIDKRIWARGDSDIQPGHILRLDTTTAGSYVYDVMGFYLSNLQIPHLAFADVIDPFVPDSGGKVRREIADYLTRLDDKGEFVETIKDPLLSDELLCIRLMDLNDEALSGYDCVTHETVDDARLLRINQLLADAGLEIQFEFA